MAQSSTVHASGPQTSVDCENGSTPARLTKPGVGFIPATPQKAAGWRIEPAVSLPRAAGTSPAATATPEPLDEPPEKRRASHGFRAGGQGRSKDGPP